MQLYKKHFAGGRDASGYRDTGVDTDGVRSAGTARSRSPTGKAAAPAPVAAGVGARRQEKRSILYDVEQRAQKRRGVCFDCTNARGIWRDRCGADAGASALHDMPSTAEARKPDLPCGPSAELWRAR